MKARLLEMVLMVSKGSYVSLKGALVTVKTKNMNKLWFFVNTILFICGFFGLVVCGVTTALSQDDVRYSLLPFLSELRVFYVVILCILLLFPLIITLLKDERAGCRETIGAYLFQMTMINRGKKNGHGNPYTKEEQEELRQVKQKIEKIERRIRIINIILLRFRTSAKH